MARKKLPVPANTADTSVVHIRYFDAASLRTRMYNLIVADVDPHMSIITDHISRLLLRFADRSAAPGQRAGISGSGDAKMCMHQIDKPGTVSPVCQTVSSKYIRISHKLQSIGCDGTSSSGRTAAVRRTSSGGSATGRIASGRTAPCAPGIVTGAAAGCVSSTVI